jgi:hypothetical protein
MQLILLFYDLHKPCAAHPSWDSAPHTADILKSNEKRDISPVASLHPDHILAAKDM